MTVTLAFPPDVERAYLAEAQASGLPLGALVGDVLLAPSLKTLCQVGFGGYAGNRLKWPETTSDWSCAQSPAQ